MNCSVVVFDRKKSPLCVFASMELLSKKIYRCAAGALYLTFYLVRLVQLLHDTGGPYDIIGRELVELSDRFGKKSKCQYSDEKAASWLTGRHSFYRIYDIMTEKHWLVCSSCQAFVFKARLLQPVEFPQVYCEWSFAPNALTIKYSVSPLVDVQPLAVVIVCLRDMIARV